MSRCYNRFILSVLISACLAALAVGPRTVLAQQQSAEQRKSGADQASDEAVDSDDDAFFGDSHRQRIYEESRLSRTRAVAYNLVLPGLGNIYAEQYLYAGLAMSLMAFATLFAGYGLYTDQSQYVWTGAGTAGAAYLGSIVTSLLGVHAYNEELQGNLNVGLAPASEDATVGLQLRF